MSKQLKTITIDIDQTFPVEHGWHFIRSDYDSSKGCYVALMWSENVGMTTGMQKAMESKQ